VRQMGVALALKPRRGKGGIVAHVASVCSTGRNQAAHGNWVRRRQSMHGDCMTTT
jgi:hypothetical protein